MWIIFLGIGANMVLTVDEKKRISVIRIQLLYNHFNKTFNQSINQSVQSINQFNQVEGTEDAKRERDGTEE